MKKNTGLKIFEKIRKADDEGNEFWSARDLSQALEYSEYRHFLPVIAKAKESCENSKRKVLDHFEELLEMVEIGSGATRGVDDIKLSRYACYLILQNANPVKEVVALGQSYFATQTRLQEIEKSKQYQSLSSEDEKRLFLRSELTRHNIQLASVAKQAGVIDPVDYAIFQRDSQKEGFKKESENSRSYGIC
jgi:DNA-damage-inducible protein D